MFLPIPAIDYWPLTTIHALTKMNPPNLRLSIITESDQLESLRPAWSDLLARSASNEPMLSPLWLATWWRIYGPATGRQLRIGLFFDGQRLVGLAPLCRRVYWYHRCIPFRRIEFLGADAEESDGVCSEYLNVIAERGLEEAVAQALASSLAGRAFGPWDEVVLSALDGDHAMSAVLIDAFRERGTGKRERGTGNRERGIFCSLFPSLERLTMAESPYIPLPASWEAYLAGLHQDQRYFIKRSMRDFEAWAGPDWQVHDVTAPAELAEGMRILTSLHTGRWSAENQAAPSRRHVSRHSTRRLRPSCSRSTRGVALAERSRRADRGLVQHGLAEQGLLLSDRTQTGPSQRNSSGG